MPGHMARGRRGVQEGVSLAELVVALGLMAVAAAGLLGLVRMTVQAVALIGDGLDGQQGARRALERITEELRWGESVVPDATCAPTGLCQNRVSVRIPAGNPYRRAEAYEVAFQHNPRQREVERRLGRGVNNLASRIDAFEVTYHDAQGVPTPDPMAVARVRITLVARSQAGRTVQAQNTVSLRNRQIPFAPPTYAPAWRPSPAGYGDPPAPGPGAPPGRPGPGNAR